MPDGDPARSLASLLLNASRAVAFTGAGVSTESGIPDFRSPGGVWSRNPPIPFGEFVTSREARSRYWKQRLELYRDFASAQPNFGHVALARLERAGYLKGVVTQNIDGLHQMAGSRRVVELHGTTRVVACIECGKEWTPDEVHARVIRGDEAPDCDECGAPLKSKTISFGQAMPEGPMEEARALTEACDLFVVIGSSLVVEPAASFPRLAKRHGAALVIVNHTPTPLDALADLLIHDSIGRTMKAVLNAMGREVTR